MPVTYNESKSKWCMGENCNYGTKEKAEAAEKAYYANLEKKEVKNRDLAKSFNEDKRIFTSIALKADYRDSDGKFEDFWPKDVVSEAAWDFMENCQAGNISHIVNSDLLKVVESFISPVDFEMGGGFVNKGDWVVSLRINDPDLWELCKNGEFTGFSVGCPAMVEVEDD